jgi:hypothetical protein
MIKYLILNGFSVSDLIAGPGLVVALFRPQLPKGHSILLGHSLVFASWSFNGGRGHLIFHCEGLNSIRETSVLVVSHHTGVKK